MQLCGSLNILWHCLSLGSKWKLTFSSPVATAEFSKLVFHIIQIIKYSFFCEWLISLTIMLWKFIHVTACIEFHSFSRLDSIYHFLRAYFVHVSVVNSWYVFSFWLSWIWLLWISVHKYLFTPLAFNSFEYIPRSRITGWYSNSMFNFLKIGQTVFHSSCFLFYSQ